jgi:hypothetical protein
VEYGGVRVLELQALRASMFTGDSPCGVDAAPDQLRGSEMRRAAD